MPCVLAVRFYAITGKMQTKRIAKAARTHTSTRCDGCQPARHIVGQMGRLRVARKWSECVAPQGTRNRRPAGDGKTRGRVRLRGCFASSTPAYAMGEPVGTRRGSSSLLTSHSDLAVSSQRHVSNRLPSRRISDSAYPAAHRLPPWSSWQGFFFGHSQSC
ncbi:hypothetical protein VFPBJ_11381 [Purpureocillium lilacinum]|uniref:Uncharacterized protein n=1 Tax=Purpureocillium lilacinum TaxID=33203 RepID=A0A179FBT2_PURLI|nr:hypothetical protein VFPBJ_11381 [Purpureocillium lilacinum]